MNFCKNCPYIDKKTDICTKYNSILARNISGELFKCYNCKESYDEGKNKT